MSEISDHEKKMKVHQRKMVANSTRTTTHEERMKVHEERVITPKGQIIVKEENERLLGELRKGDIVEIKSIPSSHYMFSGKSSM